MRLIFSLLFGGLVGCGEVEKDPPAGDSDSDVDTDADSDSDSETGPDICWEFGLRANECFPKQYSAVEGRALCQCSECLAVEGFAAEYFACLTALASCWDVGGADGCMDETLAAHPPNAAAEALDTACREKESACAKAVGWGWDSDPTAFSCDLLVALTEDAANAAIPCLDLECTEVEACMIDTANAACGCSFEQ